MGGKKTVEDSRRFEKERRDKLNVAFEELCKLLPDHDPTVTLSKIEILKKAAQYIRHLQLQNDEIIKLGSDSVLSKGTESEKLRKRVTHLLLKTKELVDAMRSAGVPIPTNKKNKKKKAQHNSSNQNLIEKQGHTASTKNDCQTLKKVKCGCTKILPEKKPLKESNTAASSQSSSIDNATSASTSGQSVLSSTNLITVTPPLVSAPIMATRVQSVPVVPNSMMLSSSTQNSSVISTHVASSMNSVVIDGKKILGSTSNFNSNDPPLIKSKLPPPVTFTQKLVKEMIPPTLNLKSVVVTTVSSNVITTQSIVNSTQFINLPQNNVMSNPIVAPRIQNVLEKNILSNLGPGTLILADGRIMNVPPIVPQIVVKPQPAVILMPTAKKKEKLLISKKREVTKTTFANKAPIPAIQTFRLESFPRVRTKKKPKTLKKSEKAKNGDIIQVDQANKKRKLDEETGNKSSEVLALSENSPQKVLVKSSLCLENPKDSNLIHSENSIVPPNCSSSISNKASDTDVIEPMPTTNDTCVSSISPCTSLAECSNNLSTVMPAEKNITSVITTCITSPQGPTSDCSVNEDVTLDIQNSKEENTSLPKNNPEDSDIFTQNNSPSSSSILVRSPPSSLINSDRNVSESGISVCTEALNVGNPSEKLSSNFDVPMENTSITISNTSAQTDESTVSLNSTRSNNNAILNNIPPCISSSTEQDSIFVAGNKQVLMPDSQTRISHDKIVNTICKQVETSVNESDKNLGEVKSLNNYPQENGDIHSFSQSSASPILKYSTENDTNKTSDNTKHLEENSVISKNSNPAVLTNEFQTATVNGTSGNIITNNTVTQNESNDINLNSQSSTTKDIQRPSNDEEANFSHSRSDYYQASPCTNNSTANSVVKTGPTVSLNQNITSRSQGEVFRRNVNHVPEVGGHGSLDPHEYPHISNHNVVSQSQNGQSIVCSTNSQVSVTTHLSYGISGAQPQKDSLFFNSVFGKPTDQNPIEKTVECYNKNTTSNESNIFSARGLSIANSNEKLPASQNMMHLKPTDNLGNIMPSVRNSDAYNNFNQAVSTDIVDKAFFSQNDSFANNAFSKSSEWEKSQFNKSLNNNNFGEVSEEQNMKTYNTFYRNKNSSFEKQSENTQMAYFGFQTDPAVTSQSNVFFHNLPCSTMLPSSCGFNDTPAVFSYHNTTSAASSYTFIPHENISSLNRGSMGVMKSINQERVYPSAAMNNDKNKGNSFRNNDKLNVGNLPFYPSTSQTFIPGVYPTPSQPNLSTVYSNLTQTNLSGVYSNSSQITTASTYSNSALHNSSTYHNSISHNVASVYSSSAYPIVSSVYSNFSQTSASGVYTTSTMSSVFTRASQPNTNVYSALNHQSMSNAKNSSSIAYLNSNQHKTPSSCISLTPHVSTAYTSTIQTCTLSTFINTTNPVYSNSGLAASSNVSNSQKPLNNYSSTAQTNVSGVVTSTAASTISNSYDGIGLSNISCVYTNTSLPSISNVYTSVQSNIANSLNRYNPCSGTVVDTILYHRETVPKASETSGHISFNNYIKTSTSTLNNSSEINPAVSKTSELIMPGNSAVLNDLNKTETNGQNNCSTSLPDPKSTDPRQNKSMQTTYIHEKDVSKNKYAPDKIAPLDQRQSDTERTSISNASGKDNPSPHISCNSSKTVEQVDEERSANKFNSYDFISNNGKDVQNKMLEANVSAVKNSEIIDKSEQSKFSNEEKSLETEANKIQPISNQKSISNDINTNESIYSCNNQGSSNYQNVLQTPNTTFNSNHTKNTTSTIYTTSYSSYNSSMCESMSNRYNNEALSKARSIGICSVQGVSRSSQPESMGQPGPSTDQLTKATMVDIAHRIPEKQDKSVQKSYESGNANSLKSDLSSDFLKSKDIERNTFIPIIDDVRLSTDFSSDLFSSLQVPTGGAHSESISPTAAFLLAFPLVSTSRNVESLQDNENQENQTSTPTTILQIGNIEPPSTELFHPIDFQKTNSKPPDHFDMNNDYLHPNDLQEKQNHTPYKRCEKRKENFNEFNKEVRASDSKQKSKSTVVTTSTYTQSYTQPLLSCNEYQYCEKDSSQWQQEYSTSVTKEQKKTCDRKKEKPVQKGCFHQNFQECYNYKEKKRKQQNRISVNWMTTPEIREQAEYQNKEPEAVNNLIGPPAQSLYGGMSLDFPTEPFSDFCNTKKTNNYSWSPNKSLLPTLDNHLMIPSTLPTLVGDLALGTSTPSESYKSYETPKSQLPGQLTKKSNEKLDANKKQSEFSKNQATFFSVSQLVDPKSKKQKTGERNYKRPEKNSKPRNNFNCAKRKEDHCMYYEERNSFIPNHNQYSDKRHSYKGGSYSAESLIGVQHNEIDFSSNFNYQQNPNYFQSEFPPPMESSSQQYGYFQQTHFTGFSHEECQDFGFNSNQRGLDSNRQKGSVRKDDNYHGTSLLQPQICPPYSKSVNYNLPTSHLNTNTTTTLTNFNLSTIFPEMNDQRVGASVQPPQQMNNSYQNSQNYRSHLS